MRWNCPHCEELVTAGIDFENTKKAYVRCAKCGGMALVHRSAALADYVKARRMEEEAQLEAEIKLTEAMEAQTELAAAVVPITPPPPNAQMAVHAGMNVDMDSDYVEEKMDASSFDLMDEEEIMVTPLVASPAPMEMMSNQSLPPAFPYAKPPAFLMKPAAMAIESVDRSFETAETESRTTPAAASSNENRIKMNPTLTLWFAAALATASGIYLFIEGQKAFAPTPQTTDSSRSEKTTH